MKEERSQKSGVRSQKSEKKTTEGTERKGAELLQVKDEKAIDTLKAREIATWALGHHQGTRAGAMFALASAIACGIQLEKAKAFLPHGEFQRWQKKYLGSFTYRTAATYMTVVDQIRAKGKYEAVSHLLDIAPETMTFEYARGVSMRIQKIVQASTMKELLQDNGTIAPPKPCDQAAQDRRARVEAKDPRTEDEKQMLFAEEFWGDVEHSISNFAKFFDGGLRSEEVKMKTREKAVSRLTELIEQLTGGKVEVKYE